MAKRTEGATFPPFFEGGGWERHNRSKEENIGWGVGGRKRWSGGKMKRSVGGGCQRCECLCAFLSAWSARIYHLHQDIFAVSRQLPFGCDECAQLVLWGAHTRKHASERACTHAEAFIRSAVIGLRSVEIENMISSDRSQIALSSKEVLSGKLWRAK